jgi:lipoprotein
MKKMFTIFMLLAAVFTSACANEQAARQGAQSVQNVKAVSGKKGDFASTYLSNIDKDAEEYVADFDLHQYLLDSGAISIDRVSTGFDEEISIVARYPNDIIVNYDFEIPSGRQYGYLYYMVVNVAEKGYNLANLYGATADEGPETGVLSEWFHSFSMLDPSVSTNDPSYSQDVEKFYTVKPDDIFYIETKDGKRKPLVVQDYFDKGFKTSILPYIQLKDPSYRKDPMEGKLDGKTKYEYD